MAFAEITLKNPQTGEMKIAPVGYSWTVGFFGPIVPLFFRKDPIWAIIILIGNLATFGLGGFIFGFFYNKIYIKNLIKKGFKVTYISTGDLNFASAKIGMRLPIIEEEFKKNMNGSFY